MSLIGLGIVAALGVGAFVTWNSHPHLAGAMAAVAVNGFVGTIVLASVQGA